MRDDTPDWQRWTWDETLFAGSAPYYERGRTPYAPGLEEAMRDALALDGRGRLLDAGCGPGTVALRLASLFEEVVGLDPDVGMLAEAARLAAERGVTNASWVRERAEALPAGLGNFRVVTFAASFHWMDRPRVAAAVRTMLEPGGFAVQLDAPAYRLPDGTAEDGDEALPHPAPPLDAIDELRARYLGKERRAGQSVRTTSPDGEDAIFQAAGFAPGRRVIVQDGRVLVRSIDDLVAQVFSSSPTAPHHFGEKLRPFEEGLRRVLAAASHTGLFAVRLPDNILTIWRPL